jgi:hypothetical protein
VLHRELRADARRDRGIALASAAVDPCAAAVDPCAAAVDAVVDAIAAAVESVVDAIAAPVQAPVDPVSAPVELRGAALVAGLARAPRGAVEAGVDAVSLCVEAVIDPVSAPVEAALDPIAAVALRVRCVLGERRTGGKAQADRDRAGEKLPHRCSFSPHRGARVHRIEHAIAAKVARASLPLPRPSRATRP